MSYLIPELTSLLKIRRITWIVRVIVIILYILVAFLAWAILSRFVDNFIAVPLALSSSAMFYIMIRIVLKRGII